MQKITIKTIKKHCKGYTEAFGYYSCRKTDFDWLINEVIESKRLRQKSAKMIIAIAYLNERISRLQAKKERLTLGLLQEKNKVVALNKEIVSQVAYIRELEIYAPKLCICCEEITEENAHLHRNCGK